MAQYPATLQSHRAIFTSKYYFQTDQRHPDETETLAGLLKHSGWHTAAFVDSGFMHRKFGHNTGFDVYDDEGGHLARIRPKAIKWLQENGQKKFFLFVHTYDIHSPYEPPKPFDKLYQDIHYAIEKTATSVKSSPEKHEAVIPRSRIFPHGARTQLQLNAKSKFNSTSTSDYSQLSRWYDGGIRYCDSELVAFFEEFCRMNLWENTVIVILSDHGESLGEKSHVGHGTLQDVQLQIPLMIRIPGEPPRMVTDAVESVDLMPTLLTLFNISFRMDIRGRDLSARLFNRLPAFENRIRFSESRGKSIRNEEGWKYIMRETPENDELYNIGMDPEENHNLLAKEPAIAEKLRRELSVKMGMNEADIRQMTVKQTEAPSIDKLHDDILVEQLKMLGYIN